MGGGVKQVLIIFAEIRKINYVNQCDRIWEEVHYHTKSWGIFFIFDQGYPLDVTSEYTKFEQLKRLLRPQGCS